MLLNLLDNIFFFIYAIFPIFPIYENLGIKLLIIQTFLFLFFTLYIPYSL